MAERRSRGARLLTFAVLVLALAVTAILWWTFAGSYLGGVNTNILYLGEVAFQFLVLGVPIIVIQRRRRRPALQSDQA